MVDAFNIMFKHMGSNKYMGGVNNNMSKHVGALRLFYLNFSSYFLPPKNCDQASVSLACKLGLQMEVSCAYEIRFKY